MKLHGFCFPKWDFGVCGTVQQSYKNIRTHENRSEVIKKQLEHLISHLINLLESQGRVKLNKLKSRMQM